MDGRRLRLPGASDGQVRHANVGASSEASSSPPRASSSSLRLLNNDVPPASKPREIRADMSRPVSALNRESPNETPPPPKSTGDSGDSGFAGSSTFPSPSV